MTQEQPLAGHVQASSASIGKMIRYLYARRTVSYAYVRHRTEYLVSEGKYSSLGEGRGLMNYGADSEIFEHAMDYALVNLGAVHVDCYPNPGTESSRDILPARHREGTAFAKRPETGN